jgi:hypothetical protein
MSHLVHKNQATNTTTTTTRREDSPASAASGFMGGQSHQTNHGEGPAHHQAASQGGASRKLEELFVYWLSQKETTEMVEHCVTAVRQGQALPCESALEVSVGEGRWEGGEGRMN